LKKPWQPQELEDAVREAAAEYDRLIETATQLDGLRNDLRKLHDRIAALEQEVERLRK